MTDALWSATRALATRADLRVMVIAAEGDYFTSGIDLGSAVVAETSAAAQRGDLVEYRRLYRQHHLLYDEFEAIEKPIVLAVQGHCFGAGVEMAASCDFRLAASGTTFALPEVQIGVIAGSGGIGRLCRLVGPHWTKWMSMAGQRVDADRALTMGLVHDVVPPQELGAAVDRLVADLLAIPPGCLGVAKLAIDIAVDTDRVTQRHVERIANGPLLASPDFVDRTSRFR